MTKNLDKEGLSSIVDNYNLFYIDLWGVVHNGVNLYQSAIDTLKEISKKKKRLCSSYKCPKTKQHCKEFFKKDGYGQRNQ